MKTFRLGDRARVVRGFPEGKSEKILGGKIIGCECVISHIGGNGIKKDGTIIPVDCGIQIDDGRIFSAMFWQLEPIINLGSWDEIAGDTGWRPSDQEEMAASMPEEA